MSMHHEKRDAIVDRFTALKIAIDAVPDDTLCSHTAPDVIAFFKQSTSRASCPRVGVTDPP